MPQVQIVQADVAIFGGGIAGLWLLARLRNAGFNAVLLETRTLGAGQTHYAQGIIHGGTKYALTGSVGSSANAIADMPRIWRDCLAGTGELDLREVKILSPFQYMWSTEKLTSRLAGFFASHLMRSRTKPLDKDEQPVVFQTGQFKGQVYRLEEPVLDTASLIKALAQPHESEIWPVHGAQNIHFGSTGKLGTPPAVQLTAPTGQSVKLQTKRLVLAAGKGNQALLAALNRSQPVMQLRPVHMVMMRGLLLDGVFAHCIGMTDKPRITITTHKDRNGQTVWYLGGQLAEDGVQRTPLAQLDAARSELTDILPWLDFSAVQWASLLIDRAEPRQPGSKRPDNAFVEEQDGIITAWPVKMALAPMLAQNTINLLKQGGVTPGTPNDTFMWPERPSFAPLPWDEETVWS
jgi:glycerol-3-phosphate dehydrogenase